MKPKAASPSRKSPHGSSLGTTAKPKTRTTASSIAHAAAFDEVLHLIQSPRHRTFQAANAELINLYWNVGAYVSTRIAAESWGKGTVNQLSAYIQQRQPGLRGFSASNIWRMRQFHDTYRNQPNLATMLREVPWSSNLHILNKCKLPEEHQLNFYLEALDRDIRKPHENPSVGVLLYKSKDAEVVDYALSRSMSPAMIAEYKTNLPDRALLQRKLHEFYEQLALPEPPSKASAKR